MIAALAVTAVVAILLLGFAIRDCRRTFRRIEADRRRPVDAVDFAGEIRAYKLARDRNEEERAVR